MSILEHYYNVYAVQRVLRIIIIKKKKTTNAVNVPKRGWRRPSSCKFVAQNSVYHQRGHGLRRVTGGYQQNYTVRFPSSTAAVRTAQLSQIASTVLRLTFIILLFHKISSVYIYNTTKNRTFYRSAKNLKIVYFFLPIINQTLKYRLLCRFNENKTRNTSHKYEFLVGYRFDILTLEPRRARRRLFTGNIFIVHPKSLRFLQW